MNPFYPIGTRNVDDHWMLWETPEPEADDDQQLDLERSEGV